MDTPKQDDRAPRWFDPSDGLLMTVLMLWRVWLVLVVLLMYGVKQLVEYVRSP